MAKTLKREAANQKHVARAVDGTKAYAALRSEVLKAGILDRSYSYYFMTIVFTFAAFSFGMYQVITLPLSWSLVVWSFIVAFFAVQIAGVMHDAGHRAIFESTRWNDIVGYICASLFGMGYDSWKIKHNAHHAHPNEEDEDPDVELPILSFTQERFYEKKGIIRLLTKYQAYLYYPIGSLVVFSTRISNINYFVNNVNKGTWWKLLIYLIGLFAWFILPFIMFDLPKAFIATAIFNITAGLYLLNVFAPNHKGMPHLKKGTKMSFLEQQVITSRNITGNWLNDYIYMGLNYQIEHHLFPNCPRNKLKYITPHLLDVCKKMKIEYTQVGVLETNKIILSELHQISKLPRPKKS